MDTTVANTVFDLYRTHTAALATHRTTATPSDIQAALEALARRPTLPSHGLGTHGAIEVILNDVLQGLAKGHAGPRYFGFITGGALPSAQLADFLTTIYDQSVAANRPDESISTVIESRALEYVLDLLSLPRGLFPARTLTTGATASNVLGLALARDHAVRHALGSSTHSVSEDGFAGIKVTVYTDRPHASLFKAAAIVGIGRANVVDLGKPLAGTETIGIDLEELEGYLGDAGPGSGRAAVVSLSFGEVNTGDFTPHVREIRALCDTYSVWLHIDAAFGAFARLVPDMVGPVADGLELGDSIASDAHKWLNVPYDCGLFFSRSTAHQMSVFGPSPKRGAPAYYTRTDGKGTRTAEMEAATEIPDGMNVGIENSRRFRGLPLYAALLDQGREGYADIVRRNIGFARRVAAWMGGVEGRGYYEVLNLRGGTTPLNMVLFRAASTNPVEEYRRDAGALMRAINETGTMMVTPGPGGVRMAISNWMTGDADFGRVVEVLVGVCVLS